MTENTIPSAEDLYKRAYDIKPVLKSRAEETAKLRRLTDETIQDFKDLGFFKIVQPKRWGGYEMDPIVFYKVTSIIGEACMPSAWVKICPNGILYKEPSLVLSGLLFANASFK